MIADLLLLAALCAFWVIRSRLSVSTLKARLFGGRVELDLRHPLFLLLSLAVLLALFTWSQHFAEFGRAAVVEAVKGGPSPYEVRTCFERQQQFERSGAANYGARKPRCPFGGGELVEQDHHLRCQLHGRAP